MRIATVNVNGIRAAARKGMNEWLAAAAPDALLLQEVRAPDEVARDLLPGWHVASAASQIKGRSGVVVATRAPLGEVRIGLDETNPAHTGRWIEADLDVNGDLLTLVSTYVHSGTVGTPSMDDKYAFLAMATERMAQLAADGRRALVAGDLNITHTDADLKNFRANRNKVAGCLDEERAWLTRWFGSGWVDVHRALVGPVQGPYTWWSWRGQAFDNDAGWRIDYHVATPALAERAQTVSVDRAASYDTRFSDHSPLVIDYDL